MNVLLLGAAGYLGGNIVRQLSAAGDRIFCVVRRTSDISGLAGIKNLRLISSDPGQIELTLQQEGIGWVINAACAYRPNESLYGDMLESNCFFPLRVLNLAAKHRIRNYMTMGTGLPEEFNVYSFTKAKLSDFGRFFSEQEGMNFAELRLEMFYGGFHEPEGRFLRACKRKLGKGEALELTEGEQKRDIIRVEDIVEIIEKIVHSDYVRGYRLLPVGSGEQHSVREIVAFMKTAMGSESELRFGAVPGRAGEPDTLADIGWYKELGVWMNYTYFGGLKKMCAEPDETGDRANICPGGGINGNSITLKQ